MIKKLIFVISGLTFVPFIVKLSAIVFLEYLFNVLYFFREKKVKIKRVRNKFCLITGGTKGIGRELVELLIKKGYEVLVLGRNRITGIETKFHRIDLCNIAEVKKFKINRQIDLLVFNAGVLTTEIEDIDLNFKINYLSHFILYINLRHNLTNARIVLTSSCVMLSVDTFDPFSTSFFSFRKYCESKLCVFLLAKYISKKHQAVVVHPGIVNTGLFARNRLLNIFISKISYFFLNSKEEASHVLLNACQCEIYRKKKIIFLYGFDHMKIPRSINSNNLRHLIKISKKILSQHITR